MSKTKELQSVSASTDSALDDNSDDSMGYHGYGAMRTRKDNHELDSVEESIDVVPFSKRLRLVKTICMLGIYIGLGLWVGVVNTSNVDMVNLYQCTYDEFNKAVSMKSIGVMGGSFLGAAISDRFTTKADLFLTIVSSIGGITLLVVPWSPNLIAMGAIFIINGLCHGTTNVVCSSITLAIWGVAAPTPVIALHTSFSLGTAIAPLLTAPFLSRTDSNKTNVVHGSSSYQLNENDESLHSTSLDYRSSGNDTQTSSSHVRIPYALFGMWSIVMGIIFLVFFIRGSGYFSKKAKAKASIKSMLNPAKCAAGSMGYGIYFIISLLFLYILVNGRDRSIPSFLFAIANKGLGMTKTMSALLLTTYGFLGATSRGICAVISKWVNIKIVLFVEIMMALLFQMYLAFYGLESDTALWVLSSCVVIFTAPTYPTVMAWADRYIEVTGAVVAMIDIGIGLGGFVALIITGNLFQNHGSQAVLTFSFILCILLTVVYLPLQIISYKRGDRHKIVSTGTNISNFPVNGTLVIEAADAIDERIYDDEQTPLFRS